MGRDSSTFPSLIQHLARLHIHNMACGVGPLSAEKELRGEAWTPSDILLNSKTQRSRVGEVIL